MGLFDKKYCDICGEKIGFLGNKKLEDGNLCKNCARKLSPFFTERRSSTVDEIRAQLQYREENAKNLEFFNADLSFGTDEKIYLDTNAKKMIVTSCSDFKENNPDIIDCTQILSFETEIEDNETELYYEDSDGNEQSYDPPKYSYAYEFHITFKVDSPYFDEISVDLNNGERPESKDSDLYVQQNMDMLGLKSIIGQWTHKMTPEEIQMGPIPGYFEQMKRRQIPFVMQNNDDVSSNEQLPNDEWTCECGNVNKSKFCTECGNARTDND